MWQEFRQSRVRQFCEELTPKRLDSILQYFTNRFQGFGRGRVYFDDLSLSIALTLTTNDTPINELISDEFRQRSVSLLPAILEELVIETPFDVLRAVNTIVVSAALTAEISRARRISTKPEQLASALREAEQKIDETYAFLRSNPELWYSLTEILHDIDSVSGANFKHSEIDKIMHLEALKLALYVAQKDHAFDDGDDGRYVEIHKAAAKPKLSAVDKAYYLSKRFGGPRFVTTPNSPFSAVAALIFEIATGTRDSSMLGSINRFKSGDRPFMSAIEWDTEHLTPTDAEMRDITINWHHRRAKLFASLFRRNDHNMGLFGTMVLGELAEQNFKETQVALETRIKADANQSDID
ncbi:hypothetical protein AUC70_05665 [Methyloceanibacter stevinii]|uniref:Uncharacterized protein n=1 Tax=Methyloceanibacter stevinii TaxID=1774970 RepID=A0A1E3VNU3_9HYPH|nr:hypothetical protein [Methyloceanibacter stevinii]ODR95194.1 hypothetical protein AUC70_05665 [Methyloceanibacter stevinii]